MRGFDHLSQYWLAWIISASWQLGLLVCLVGLTCGLARKSSARLRHGLWLLVLLKVFLPAELATPLSVGCWGIGPLISMVPTIQIAADSPSVSPLMSVAIDDDNQSNHEMNSESSLGTPIPKREFPLANRWMSAWLVGCLVFWVLVMGGLVQLRRVVHSADAIEEGPLRIAAEQIAIMLRLRRIPDLVASGMTTSPFLFGVIRPCIVLPKAFSENLEDQKELDEDQWRAILAHELVHWCRFDTWIGWVQVAAQSLFWFHPFVWWANAQLRHERECACDEAVLQLGEISPKDYGESIIRVLTVARGRSLKAASLVGVFEQGPNLQSRLEEIMNYQPTKSRFGWTSLIVLMVFGVLFIPMATTFNQGQRVGAEEPDRGKAESHKTAYPTIVETVPKIGATGIDPALNEIRVTFDRDMQGGMSWTGGPPLFPQTDENRKTRWIDKRTCVLPVVLEEASFYRVGINSTSYQNFRSTRGIPAPSSAIYFTTKGSVDDRVKVPEIVTIEPANGAVDVDPATLELRVTFNMPMGDGMSWCGAGDSYPNSPEDQAASWSKDGRTCTLPVKLDPNHEYEIGLNSLKHINFQSKWGVPLSPVAYKFRTRNSTN